MRTYSLWTVGLLLLLQGVSGASQKTWLPLFGDAEDYQEAATAMTRGAARRMSIANPKSTDDDTPATAAPKSSSSSSSSSSSTAAKDDSSSALSSSTTTKSSSSSPHGASLATMKIPSSSPVPKPNSTNRTTTNGSNTTSGDTTSSTKNATTTTNSAATKSTNKTTTTFSSNRKGTDPGEHHKSSSFKKPLPTSYNYNDDDNFPKLLDSNNHSPLNPVVDDIAQFLDDDHIHTNTTRSVLPPEKEPPSSWPIDVFAIFLGAALVLFAATAYKNYQKRKTYTSVPSSTN